MHARASRYTGCAVRFTSEGSLREDGLQFGRHERCIAAFLMQRRARLLAGLLAFTPATIAFAGDEPPLTPWPGGDSRIFAAGAVEIGVPYGFVTMMGGYGKPHWQWFGVEARGGSSTSYAVGYAGLHAGL